MVRAQFTVLPKRRHGSERSSQRVTKSVTGRTLLARPTSGLETLVFTLVHTAGQMDMCVPTPDLDAWPGAWTQLSSDQSPSDGSEGLQAAVLTLTTPDLAVRVLGADQGSGQTLAL